MVDFSDYWRCPHCKKVLVKGIDKNMRGWVQGAAGSASCEGCGGTVSQGDVYKGKYDVTVFKKQCPGCGETWEGYEEMFAGNKCPSCGCNLSSSQSESGECFIATAAYGTEFTEDVYTLKQFREEVLRAVWVGRIFINLYNATSPAIAHFISQYSSLRKIVRNIIVRPFARYAKQFLEGVKKV